MAYFINYISYFLLFCILITVGCASDETKLETGRRQYADQNFTQAFATLTPLAQKDIAEAQLYLGNLYYMGKGISKDHEKALNWYLQAARQGLAQAQFNLSLMYFDGEGVDKNIVKYLYWLKKAVKQELPQAYVNLGSCFFAGRGMKQNYKKAAEYFYKAYKKGEPEGAVRLGTMYYYGQGIKQSYRKALKCYMFAAKDSLEAQAVAGMIFVKGLGCDRDIKRGTKMIESAANAGYMQAQIAMSIMALDNNHKKQALKWLSMVKCNNGDIKKYIDKREKEIQKDKQKIKKTQDVLKQINDIWISLPN